MPKREIVLRRYAEVRREIGDSDLLLWRGRSLSAWMIRLSSRSEYSHADKAAWWGDDLFCLGMLPSGGRAVTLSSQVERYPGQIDLYQPDPQSEPSEYDRNGATRYMKRLCGWPYGWLNLIGVALWHIPLIRKLAPRNFDAVAEQLHQADLPRPKRAPYCSMACAMADRIGGGVDPVPGWADRLTEPGDLAKSAFYEYRCTLIP